MDAGGTGVPTGRGGAAAACDGAATCWAVSVAVGASDAVVAAKSGEPQSVQKCALGEVATPQAGQAMLVMRTRGGRGRSVVVSTPPQDQWSAFLGQSADC